MTQDERWNIRYNEVMEFITSNHRNPSKYNLEERNMVNFLKHASRDGSVWYCFAIFGGIGRYRASDYKETCVCIRGHFEEYMYGFAETRSDGNLDPNSFGIVETVDMYPGGPILNIEKGQWHSLK